jgi:predicted AlkP superfamily phosphohydrolase/phosphomutase
VTVQTPPIIHIGIDGGSFKVLDALARRGVMPEYSALVEQGGRARLRSTTPWFTVPAWISWMTGIRAERHGLIYWTATAARDYWERGGAAGRFVASTDIRYPTVFRILSNAGHRVASLNMPVTFPPPDVDGVMVPGFLAPTDSGRVAHPPGFLDRYPDYRVDLEEGPDAGPVRMRTDAQVATFARQMSAMAESRHRVLIDLLLEEFRLASVVYVGADRLSHVAWPQVEAVMRRAAETEGEKAIEAYYATIDRLLGDTRRALPHAVLLITSDHGQGPPPPRVIAPNVWLQERGWITLRAREARRAAHLLAWPGLRRRLWAVYRKLRNMPRGSAPFVDWERTDAYGIILPHCRAMGIAVRGDRQLQEQIAQALLALTDSETGEAPVRRVLFASDICDDHARSTFPELIALLKEGYGAVGSLDGPVVRSSEGGPSGYHEPDGILAAVGPGVGRGEHPEASICDIAPSLLMLCGVRPPEEMDGRVIPWLGTAGHLTDVAAEPEPVSDEGLDRGEEDRIAEHLRSLGYIE